MFMTLYPVIRNGFSFKPAAHNKAGIDLNISEDLERRLITISAEYEATVNEVILMIVTEMLEKKAS